jgi:hypothetical protein
VNNWKRFTVCKVKNHKWARIAYQPGADDSQFFLRCQRCGKENHEGSSVRPTII